jgi:hypothetical protein
MTLLQQIEKALDQQLRAAFGGGRENGREAIELYREVLEEVSRRTTPGLRGEPVFPFNRIRIALKAEDAERRAVLETIFSAGQLANDIRACLKESRASAPSGLAIGVEFQAEQADEMELSFELAETPASVPAPAPARIPARLVTVMGSSSAAAFDLDADSLQIGRGPQVIDSSGRTVRRNGLFFADDAAASEINASDINGSVSRAHAHLLFDAASGGWRIYDDGSTFGTGIFRHGRRIDVPAHGTRGVGLHAGDEIWLGNACLRFETGP